MAGKKRREKVKRKAAKPKRATADEQPVPSTRAEAIDRSVSIMRRLDSWAALTRELGSDCELLRQDPLYALPTKLVDILQARAKDIWKDEAPERKLATLCEGIGAVGFAHQRPVNYVYLQAGPTPEPSDETMAICKEQEPERTEADIRESLRRSNEYLDLINEQLRGFLGWLVTEPAYRQELNSLREQGHTLVEEAGEFPNVSWVHTDADLQKAGVLSPLTDNERAFREAYREFCKRWCLRRLVTWELPEPRGPLLSVPPGPVSTDLASQGVLLFLPFGLIGHGKLSLSEFFDKIQAFDAPQHLQGWVQRESTSRMGEGVKRFAALFLFDFHWRVIEGRYGQRLRRCRTPVKRAIGDYIAGYKDVSWAEDERRGLALGEKLFALRKKRLAGAENAGA